MSADNPEVIPMSIAGWGCIIFLGIGLITGGLVGSCASRKALREDAVKAGVAEYQADPKTGDTKFTFKTK